LRPFGAKVSPLLVAALLALGAAAAGCGGGSEGQANGGGGGGGGTSGDCEESGGCEPQAAAQLDCRESTGCVIQASPTATAPVDCDQSSTTCVRGKCEESGECVLFSKVIQINGSAFACNSLDFDSIAPGMTESGSDTSEPLETSSDLQTTSDAGAETAEQILLKQATGCRGVAVPLVDLAVTDLPTDAVEIAPDGSVAWSGADIRLTGVIRDGALHVTEVQP